MSPAQLSLLDAALPSSRAASRARDEGVTQVAQHAEEHRPSFQEEAQDFVLWWLLAHGPTAGEVLTIECKKAGIVPHDDRAFGAVYLALVKKQRIEKVGTVKRLRGHNTAGGNVWAIVAHVRQKFDTTTSGVLTGTDRSA